MNRQEKVNQLMGRSADDVRRFALDAIDATARNTSTFGGKEHRDARDKTEKQHDEARRAYEGFSDDQLDAALLVPPAPVVTPSR